MPTTAPTQQSKKKRKSAVKHNDGKTTQHMSGVQLLEASLQYTSSNIAKRVPEEVQKEHSISNIVKQGTNVGKKTLDEKKIAHADETASKKRQSTTWSQTPLEEEMEEAQTLEIANDLAWKSRDAIKLAMQLDKVLKKSYWSSVPVHSFFEELQKVFPHFYNTGVSQMTKSFLMRSSIYFNLHRNE
jgi:hypothetical protein